jgi:hypothetical protein
LIFRLNCHIFVTLSLGGSQDFDTPFRRSLEGPVLAGNCGELMARREGGVWVCYYQNAIIARCETRPQAIRFLEEQFPAQLAAQEQERQQRLAVAREYLWRRKS